MKRVTIIPSHQMTLFGPRITIFTKDGKSYTKQSTGREFIWDFDEEVRRIRGVTPGLPIPPSAVRAADRDLPRSRQAAARRRARRPYDQAVVVWSSRSDVNHRATRESLRGACSVCSAVDVGDYSVRGPARASSCEHFRRLRIALEDVGRVLDAIGDRQRRPALVVLARSSRAPRSTSSSRMAIEPPRCTAPCSAV